MSGLRLAAYVRCLTITRCRGLEAVSAVSVSTWRHIPPCCLFQRSNWCAMQQATACVCRPAEPTLAHTHVLQEIFYGKEVVIADREMVESVK